MSSTSVNSFVGISFYKSSVGVWVKKYDELMKIETPLGTFDDSQLIRSNNERAKEAEQIVLSLRAVGQQVPLSQQTGC
jgi:hypothetical protein